MYAKYCVPVALLIACATEPNEPVDAGPETQDNGAEVNTLVSGQVVEHASGVAVSAAVVCEVVSSKPWPCVQADADGRWSLETQQTGLLELRVEYPNYRPSIWLHAIGADPDGVSIPLATDDELGPLSGASVVVRATSADGSAPSGLIVLPQQAQAEVRYLRGETFQARWPYADASGVAVATALEGREASVDLHFRYGGTCRPGHGWPGPRSNSLLARLESGAITWLTAVCEAERMAVWGQVKRPVTQTALDGVSVSVVGAPETDHFTDEEGNWRLDDLVQGTEVLIRYRKEDHLDYLVPYDTATADWDWLLVMLPTALVEVAAHDLEISVPDLTTTGIVSARIVEPPENHGTPGSQLRLERLVDGQWSAFGEPLYYAADADLPDLSLDETTIAGSAIWLNVPPGPVRVVFETKEGKPCEPLQGWYGAESHILRAEVAAGAITEMEARCPPVPINVVQE